MTFFKTPAYTGPYYDTPYFGPSGGSGTGDVSVAASAWPYTKDYLHRTRQYYETHEAKSKALTEAIMLDDEEAIILILSGDDL